MPAWALTSSIATGSWAGPVTSAQAQSISVPYTRPLSFRLRAFGLWFHRALGLVGLDRDGTYPIDEAQEKRRRGRDLNLLPRRERIARTLRRTGLQEPDGHYA